MKQSLNYTLPTITMGDTIVGNYETPIVAYMAKDDTNADYTVHRIIWWGRKR